MSVKVSTWVWDHFNGKASDLLVMLALADKSNDEEGACWPGTKRLREMCRIETERGLQKITARLQKSGEIGVELHGGMKTPSGNTNKYYINGYRQSIGLAPLYTGKHPLSGDAEMRKKFIGNPEGVNQWAPHEVPDGAPDEVNGGAPKPSLEPSVEQSLKDSGASAPTVAHEGQSDGVKGEPTKEWFSLTIPERYKGYQNVCNEQGITPLTFGKWCELPNATAPTSDAGKATPANGAKAEPVQEKKPDPYAWMASDELAQAIQVVFNLRGGSALNMWHWFQCHKQAGKVYGKLPLPRAVTPAELRGFPAWYRTQEGAGPSIVTKAEKVQSFMIGYIEWLDKGGQAASTAKAPEASDDPRNRAPKETA